MPVSNRYYADFCSGSIYHIYNRTNNKEALFINDENRFFFLKKYQQYLSPLIETYCWCLLPNHFHFLIRVRSERDILATLKSRSNFVLSVADQQFISNETGLSELIEHAFSRFFQSYTLAFNKAHNRKGNLFYKSFKRLLVRDESHLTQAILYVHANPVNHGLVNDLDKYKWSSFHDVLSDKPTWLNRQDILEWFGGKEPFLKAHNGALGHPEFKYAIEE